MTEQALSELPSMYSCIPLSAQGSPYTAEDRLQAVSAYVTSGNTYKVAELVNIPRRTIQEWTTTEWWHDALTLIRLENQEEIDASYQNIIMLGLNAQRDRIEHGDWVLNNEGGQIRKPVNLRDVSVATAVAVDKLRLIRNQPTTISGNTGTDAKLAILAEKMMEISKKQQEKDITPE